MDQYTYLGVELLNDYVGCTKSPKKGKTWAGILPGILTCIKILFSKGHSALRIHRKSMVMKPEGNQGVGRSSDENSECDTRMFAAHQ